MGVLEATTWCARRLCRGRRPAEVEVLLVMERASELSKLSGAELNVLAEDLELQERSISKRRAKLHELITFRRTSGNGDGTPATPEQLADLDRQEQQISSERRELHQCLDAVRKEQTQR